MYCVRYLIAEEVRYYIVILELPCNPYRLSAHLSVVKGKEALLQILMEEQLVDCLCSGRDLILG